MSDSSGSSIINPITIGLYGISSSGKSSLINRIKKDSNYRKPLFEFYEGSDLIENVVEGGLTAFKSMAASEKVTARENAIAGLHGKTRVWDTTVVVAGHYMLQDSETAEPERIATAKDWEIYTHMIYLDVDAEEVELRRKEDTARIRPNLSANRLRKWQQQERSELRQKCLEKGIVFATISNRHRDGKKTVQQLKALLTHFHENTEEENIGAVRRRMSTMDPGLTTILMLDADRTLAPQDTGALFWNYASRPEGYPNNPLKALFKAQDYTYNSFTQASLLYEKSTDEFDSLCGEVAEGVDLYPEMKDLLSKLSEKPHVKAVVVTCGLELIWKKVLKREGLSHIEVRGNGLLKHGYVITGEVKGQLVDMFHDKGLRVVAFGDSSLDMAMLQKADGAYVVVGDEETRSKTMDAALSQAIDNGLSALQVVLPSPASHRLDLNRLPKCDISLSHDQDLILGPHPNFEHVTSLAADLLATPTRNATLHGPGLRAAHERVGYYLAIDQLSHLLGLEEIDIPHVQGRPTPGHRIRHEKATLIIPLMRGGEPMALGISSAMPLAAFVHAKTFADVDARHWVGKRTIILVDSVINSGNSVADFLAPLRRAWPFVRIVVVAGVIQADAKRKGRLADMVKGDGMVSVVALRESANKYKGLGGTDTGHRLFNTTNLD